MICNKEVYKDDRAVNIGSFSTTTDLYSALDTFGASLNDHDAKDIYFTCSASPFYDPQAAVSEIYGTFYRSSSGRYFVECNNSLSSNISTILMWRWGGGWALNRGIQKTTVNATTDTNGNAAVLAANTGIPVAFDPASDSYDKLPTMFISPQTRAVYIHLAEWSNGNAITGQTVKGTLYYIPM